MEHGDVFPKIELDAIKNCLPLNITSINLNGSIAKANQLLYNTVNIKFLSVLIVHKNLEFPERKANYLLDVKNAILYSEANLNRNKKESQLMTFFLILFHISI